MLTRRSLLGTAALAALAHTTAHAARPAPPVPGDDEDFWREVQASLLALVGGALGLALGLSVAGVATLATLAASASYIAAPTAMRIAVPQANPSLSIGLALGVTFPFNVLVGIPLYIELARRAAG